MGRNIPGGLSHSECLRRRYLTKPAKAGWTLGSGSGSGDRTPQITGTTACAVLCCVWLNVFVVHLSGLAYCLEVLRQSQAQAPSGGKNKRAREAESGERSAFGNYSHAARYR